MLFVRKAERWSKIWLRQSFDFRGFETVVANFIAQVNEINDSRTKVIVGATECNHIR